MVWFRLGGMALITLEMMPSSWFEMLRLMS